MRHLESLEAKSAVAFTFAQAVTQKITRDVQEIQEEEVKLAKLNKVTGSQNINKEEDNTPKESSIKDHT